MVKIIKIISTWKKKPTTFDRIGRENAGVPKGHKMVQAIVKFTDEGRHYTRHIAIPR